MMVGNTCTDQHITIFLFLSGQDISIWYKKAHVEWCSVLWKWLVHKLWLQWKKIILVEKTVISFFFLWKFSKSRSQVSSRTGKVSFFLCLECKEYFITLLNVFWSIHYVLYPLHHKVLYDFLFFPSFLEQFFFLVMLGCHYNSSFTPFVKFSSRQ